jgi:hypothetical protein
MVLVVKSLFLDYLKRFPIEGSIGNRHQSTTPHLPATLLSLLPMIKENTNP